MKTTAFLSSFFDHLLHIRGTGAPPATSSSAGAEAGGVTCAADGAPPMPTAHPVTIRPLAWRGRVLSFVQEGVDRYACLNLPQQAKESGSAGRKWPLFIYLHGSRATPGSLYTLGRSLFGLHDSYGLAGDPATRGFIVLSPMGRRATPWGALTGTGFHWDEWHRNPTTNLDALAIDHFMDEVIATGRVDTNRIYVFGWSNGAYMAALYGMWRSDRIAAIAQYAGGDPWSREPCPVPLTWSRKVPLFLLRNLCDHLVPYEATQPWIETLRKESWPFAYESLDLLGGITSPDRGQSGRCSTIRGLFEHIRWPRQEALEKMLQFLQQHPLP